jgi:hypothetical protein
MTIVQNGYPVEKTAAGNTIAAHQDRTADSIALASTAASTDSDCRGLELLRNEFNDVQAWSDAFVRARSSMSAANLAMSESPLGTIRMRKRSLLAVNSWRRCSRVAPSRDDAACH